MTPKPPKNQKIKKSYKWALNKKISKQMGAQI